MGTSSSSSGPRAGVPFDPPWVSSVALEIGAPLERISGEGSQPGQNLIEAGLGVRPVKVAPSGRFRNARRCMGKEDHRVLAMEKSLAIAMEFILALRMSAC